MTRPHILVLSPHSGIAEGLTRLLSFDDRFDVRRAATPAELGRLARWRPDVVLVDGVVLSNGDGVLALPAPALVLSGRAEDAKTLLPRVPTARGWLRKDPTYPELVRALASVGASPSPVLSRSARVAATFAVAVAIAGVAFSCAWLLLN